MKDKREIRFATGLTHWLMGLVACTLLLTGCKDQIFSAGAECPDSNDGKVHIKVSILGLKGAEMPLRARDSGGYPDPDKVDPFAPGKGQNERDVKEEQLRFENQITTLRVLGFYQSDITAQSSPDGRAHRRGEVAFNHLFANSNALRDLGRVAKPGALELPAFDARHEAELVFESECQGTFDLIIIANESLNATSNYSGLVDPRTKFPNDVLTDDPGEQGEKKTLDLSAIQNISDLQKAFITTPNYRIEEMVQNGNYPAGYQGALPANAWLYANGGIPMVGQGMTKIPQSMEESTVPTQPAVIGLERVLAKVVVEYTNTEPDMRIRPWTHALFDQMVRNRHLHSIWLNNYPMYAMLLPSERSESDRDYASPGTNHKLYSDPSSPFMNMYYAQEKGIPDAGNGLKMPLTPASYRSRTVNGDKAVLCRPSCFIFGYMSPMFKYKYDMGVVSDRRKDPVLNVNWIPIIRNNTIIIYSGNAVYIDPDRRVGDYVNYNDRYNSSHPIDLYVLPTTNSHMPAISGNGISTRNGEVGMTQEPTEVVVTTAIMKRPVTKEMLKSEFWSDDQGLYKQSDDHMLKDYRFRLFNRDGGNDSYAIRRNTIYKLVFNWKGKDVVICFTAQVKVLPWNYKDKYYIINPDTWEYEEVEGEDYPRNDRTNATVKK